MAQCTLRVRSEHKPEATGLKSRQYLDRDREVGVNCKTEWVLEEQFNSFKFPELEKTLAGQFGDG